MRYSTDVRSKRKINKNIQHASVIIEIIIDKLLLSCPMQKYMQGNQA